MADLDEIWDYLDQAAGEMVADRQLDLLFQRFQLLAEQRFLGRPRPDFAIELRSFAVPRTPYIVFYFPRDFGVEIVRVVHGSRRLTDLF